MDQETGVAAGGRWRRFPFGSLDPVRRTLKTFPPRAQREPAHEKAAILLHDGGETTIVVRNISEAGFMAETGRFVWIGSRIAVAWPDRGVRHAQVRWALPGRFGAAFQEA